MPVSFVYQLTDSERRHGDGDPKVIISSRVLEITVTYICLLSLIFDVNVVFAKNYMQVLDQYLKIIV